jgi:hypothetical protein
VHILRRTTVFATSHGVSVLSSVARVIRVGWGPRCVQSMRCCMLALAADGPSPSCVDSIPSGASGGQWSHVTHAANVRSRR